uniref:Serine/threonine-protein kinase RIO1 n=2 Tax=Hirondellea gigas TaxID=1518452 RepID=A0A6A7G6T6_9CRUS
MKSKMKSIQIGDIMDKTVVYDVPNSRKVEIEAVERIVQKSRIRVKGREDRATTDHVLDPRTRLILFKMLKSGIMSEINGCVSTGKEANVYHALSGDSSQHLAIKVFKTSVLDFRDRERYITGEYRFRHGYSKKNSGKMVKLWAEKEFRNLKRISMAGIPCPTPLHLRQHVLTMSFIGEGYEAAPRLKDAELTPEQAYYAYVDCVKYMRIMYQECQLVHADLSEYNLLYLNEKLYVIDVGQSVQPEHPSSHEFLMMDCKNVNDYFSRQSVEPLTVKELFYFVIDDRIPNSDSRLEELLRGVSQRVVDGSAERIAREDEDFMKTQAFAPRSLFEIEDVDAVIQSNSALGNAVQLMTCGLSAEITARHSDQSESSGDESDSSSSSLNSVDSKSDEEFSKEWEERPKLSVESKRELRRSNKKEVKIQQKEKRLHKRPKKVKKRKDKLARLRHPTK